MATRYDLISKNRKIQSLLDRGCFLSNPDQLATEPASFSRLGKTNQGLAIPEFDESRRPLLCRWFHWCTVLKADREVLLEGNPLKLVRMCL